MFEKVLPIINFELCDQCGLCVAGCPESALSMTERGPSFNLPGTCTYCTDCEALCPQGAIRAPLTIAWALEN